jgi:hypothetical protein
LRITDLDPLDQLFEVERIAHLLDVRLNDQALVDEFLATKRGVGRLRPRARVKKVSSCAATTW